MSQKINVAQIGVGYWGPNLLRNLVANKECEVKIVVDFSEDRRKFVKGLYPNIVTTDQIKDVFDDSEIDSLITLLKKKVWIVRNL